MVNTGAVGLDPALTQQEQTPGAELAKFVVPSIDWLAKVRDNNRSAFSEL